MKLESIIKDLKSRLSKKRFIHSAGVAEAAKMLASRYGADEDDAYLAGWVHDCAKELSLADMQKIVLNAHMTLDACMMNSRPLLHGPAGSVLAKTRYGISDEQVLKAIYYHTTGRPAMDLMEKIIFLADYIEPSRDFPGVEGLRVLAKDNLASAMVAAYDATLKHLMEQGVFIYPLTFEGRNDLILKQSARSEDKK
ncbi:MAG: bis(5'-nucleosyl)-tetraphosphatase (symmetrical) YqeK [Dialister sp.]|nr:bis(5'-nucleosyl)-tetraphosphatase (symmetrical) YqeK [Dialister sp.]